MRIFRQPRELAQLRAPLVLALGVFDGVHLGHQAVIQQAVRMARDFKGKSAVLTFHPHPAHVVRTTAIPRLLTTEEQDFELFSRLDVDATLVMDFTRALSRLSAVEFLDLLRSAAPRLRGVVVGRDWRFGHGREGDFKLLKKWALQHQIDAVQIKPVIKGGAPVSSTSIRMLIQKGKIKEVNQQLGRCYQIVGRVIHGKGLGKKLGFPTANLEIESELLPKNGVYATRVLIEGEVFIGAVNIGHRPTLFRGERLTVEAHLLEFDGDLYGHHLRIDFIEKIRDEKKFANVEELKHQILSDLKQAWEHSVK